MALESSKHREAATRNRKIELELASIEPFIEGLPDEEKVKLKSTLTAKYFGQKDEEKPNKDVLPAAPLVEVLKAISRLIGTK